MCCDLALDKVKDVDQSSNQCYPSLEFENKLMEMKFWTRCSSKVELSSVHSFSGEFV